MNPQTQRLLDVYGKTHRRAPTPEETRIARAHCREHFGAWLPERKDAAILDVGCGEGHLLDWLRGLGYSKLEGIDASPQMVEAAAKAGLAVERADAFAALPKRAGRHDLVFALDVLEHVEKGRVLEFLDLCRGALKPGGALILVTVNADSLGWGRIRHCDFTHESAFTESSLSQLLKAAGFSAIEYRETVVPPEVPSAWRRRLARRLCRLAFGLYRHGESGDGILARGSVLTEDILVRATA